MFRDISGLECRNCVHIEVILDFLPGTNRLLLYIARTIVCQTVCPFWCHNLEFYWENIIITTKKMLKNIRMLIIEKKPCADLGRGGVLVPPLNSHIVKLPPPPPTENKTKLILRTPPPPPGNFLNPRMGPWLTAGNEVVPSATICWQPAGHCALKCYNKIFKKRCCFEFFRVFLTVLQGMNNFNGFCSNQYVQYCFTWFTWKFNWNTKIPVFVWFLHEKIMQSKCYLKFSSIDVI